MKLFALAALAILNATPAFAAEMLYPVGSYRGQCDSSFYEHVYENGKKVGIRNARQHQRAELEVTDRFGTQTLQFKYSYTHGGRDATHEFTNQVNQTGQGTWRETGGSDGNTWSSDWRQHNDGTIRHVTKRDSDYTDDRWLLVTKERIYLYGYSELKAGAPRDLKDGHLNISTRSICTFDKQ